MEKWKIAAIVALLLSLVGFGVYQQNVAGAPPLTIPTSNLSGPASSGSPSGTSPFVGKSLPAWNFRQWSNTKPIVTSALLGKTTLIEIFRTGCSHCQEAAPFMAAIHQRYGPRGLKMIGIQSPFNAKDALDPENNWQKVQDWAKERGLNYPLAFDSQGDYFQVTLPKQFLKGDKSRLSWPMLLLIDPKGKIVRSQTGHDTAKAIQLALELEKRFPTSKDKQKNAATLMKWLAAQLPDLQLDATLSEAITNDVSQGLK